MIVLETALPAKFAATIVEALGREPERPAALRGIEQLPKRFEVMPADAEAVKRYIAAHCRRAARMKVVGFCGYSGSGKTTLVEQLIRPLQAAPASASRSSSTRTTSSTSTIRARTRGATARPAPSRSSSPPTGAWRRSASSSARPSRRCTSCSPSWSTCDWVLVEGFKHADLLKIEVWRAGDRTSRCSIRTIRSSSRSRPTAPSALPEPTAAAAARPERRRCGRRSSCSTMPSAMTTIPASLTEPAPPLLTLDEALARLLAAVAAAAGDARSRSRPSTRSAACSPQDVVLGARRAAGRQHARWTATRCAAPTCPRAGTVLPVSQRIPAGSRRRAARSRHGGAHLHRRAGAGGRRRGRDAGAVRGGRAAGVRIDAVPQPRPVDPPPRRGRARGARRAAARRAPDAAGARPRGLGRRRDAARDARGRGSRCSRPATSW